MDGALYGIFIKNEDNTFKLVGTHGGTPTFTDISDNTYRLVVKGFSRDSLVIVYG